MNSQRDTTPDDRRCCHVRNNGARCTMPALRSGQLCYAHYDRQERMRRRPHPPQWADHQVPLVLFDYAEDHASILANLNAAADAFARNNIDYRQLSAINRLYDTCLRTLRQMHRIEKAITAEEMVRDVVSAGAGELQALPDPDPAAPASPTPDPLPASPSAPAPGPALDPGPAANSISEPIPKPGDLAAIVACADPEFASLARPTSATHPANPPLFKQLPAFNPVTPLLPTHNSTPSCNPFVSHTYIFKKEKSPSLSPGWPTPHQPCHSQRTGPQALFSLGVGCEESASPSRR